MGYQPSIKFDPKLKQPITKKEDLLTYFYESCKKPKEMMIGMEVEIHGIHTDTYQPITYLEKNGMRTIQKRLIKELGWQIAKREGKYIISIHRGGTYFSLESSEGMGELAGRVHFTIHELASELKIQQNELFEISKTHKVAWLGIGYQPFTKAQDLRDVEIKRFLINTEPPEKNKSRTDDYTWRNIASVQTNVDFKSEDDARKKFQTLLRLGPFVSAMYSHSPLKDGKDSKFISYRTHIFRDLYPWRSGIRKEFFDKSFGFNEWVNFCTEVPMVAIYRHGNWVKIQNMNFSQFLKSGYQGFAPNLEDWVIQLSFIYTDTRIKNYIELRVCDSLPPFLVPSVNAITKAFVYHKNGEEAINKITKDWNFDDFNHVYEEIAKHGMEGSIQNKKLLNYCKEVIETASDFLQSFKILNEQNEDESIYLKPIKHFVFVEGKSPGTWLIENWNGPWKQNQEKLIEWCTLTNYNYESFSK